MTQQVIVQDGVAFEIEGEVDEDGKFQENEDALASKEEPADTSVPESPRATSSGPRKAGPAVNVQIVSAEPETAAVEDEPTEDELAGYEAELDAYLEELARTKFAPELVKVQSVKDKEISKIRAQAASFEERLKAAEALLEEAKLEGLTLDERTTYLDSKAVEKQKAEITAAADELDAIYKERMIELLVQDYGDFGVTAEDLDEIDDPDAAEAFCKQAEKYFLAGSGGVRKVAAAVASPVVAKPAAVVATARRPVPAGAEAPADIGGGSPNLGRSRQLNTKVGVDAMAENLNNLPWETVRIG